ncbi:tyrosine--tRNA ligase [Candidatus Micrarchaeota archaeon]|nr:tyrosine--tRNA ligase [Candidatus Micrarchaeota archaeon]
MDVETKISLIKDFAEEIVTEDDLRNIFETVKQPIAYDGFEPSGIAPIHFGLLRATNLKKMNQAGIKFKLYLADYFGFVNNKVGGDLENIRTVGKYFIEVWKASGVDTSKVEFIWAKDLMDGLEYWDQALKVAKALTLERTLRATTIMGRSQEDKLSMGQLFYPIMQVTDIFQMDVDICQLGMDQRRANILAREVADKYKWKKPAAVHHHILMGLQGIKKSATDDDEKTMMASKMSKSDPKSAIYMHDSLDQINEKLKGAYCPAKIAEGNPILEYAKYLVFKNTDTLTIERPEKYGGNLEFQSYAELEKFYLEKGIHPQDLKNAVAIKLDELIEPVRSHFEKNPSAKKLYEEVKGFGITR